MVAKTRNIDFSKTLKMVPKRGRSIGIPPALENYEVFNSGIIREAEAGIEEIWGRHRLNVSGQSSSRFHASLYAASLRNITFGFLDYRSPVGIKSASSCDSYLIFMATSGGASFEISSQSYMSSTMKACMPKLGESISSQWEADSPHLFIKIETEFLEHQLARMLGRSLHAQIIFDPILDLTSRVAWRWHSAMQLLHEEIYNRDPLTGVGNGITAIEEYIASTLLLVQRSNYTPLIVQPERQALSRVVRTATRYIEINLAQEITLADLVKVTDSSTRTIQNSFKKELGTTPLAYIRDQRLQRVRNELEDIESTNFYSLSQVAAKWGFSHYGRFAESYRQRYGELPSKTISR